MHNFMIYQEQFVPSDMQAVWSEHSTISSWLQVEQALARCQADLGVVSQDAADYLARLTVDDLDMLRLQADMQLAGRPVVGLVKQLKDQIGEELVGSVHYGATTQDIMDTGLMLQVSQALKLITDQLRQLQLLIDRFAAEYADVAVIGRTNGQHAREITVGGKLAVWSAELQRRAECIDTAAGRSVTVQYGGPVGDLKHLPAGQGEQIRQSLATILNLNSMTSHWQNARDGLHELVAALGLLCASLGKIAHNINLLSSSDIGEFFEQPQSGKGASSSMAHKRNQRCSEFMEAVARLGRQQAAAIHETSMHQHERSGGVWLSEWLIVPEVFKYTAGALMWGNRMFGSLQVNSERTEMNLEQFHAGLT